MFYKSVNEKYQQNQISIGYPVASQEHTEKTIMTRNILTPATKLNCRSPAHRLFHWTSRCLRTAALGCADLCAAAAAVEPVPTEVPAPVVNAAEFGAHTENEDNTAAIQAAINTGRKIGVFRAATYARPFEGVIDDMRIYDMALDANQIQDLYEMNS